MPSDLNEAALLSTDCQDVIDGVTDSLVSSSSMEDSPADDDRSSKVEDSSMRKILQMDYRMPLFVTCVLSILVIELLLVKQFGRSAM
jgi:hypothetical protein